MVHRYNNPIRYQENIVWKSFSLGLSALSLIMISMLSLFKCITHCSLLSVDEVKLIAIVNWISAYQIFWDFLWYLLSIKILQLIVLYFYHWYLQVWYNYYSINYLLSLVYNSFLLRHAQKGSMISVNILQLIVFYFYHCCLLNRYNYYSINYVLLLVYNSFLLRHA